MYRVDLGSLDIHGWLRFLFGLHFLLDLSLLFLFFLDLAGYVIQVTLVHMRKEIRVVAAHHHLGFLD